jgi:hypothetical protein
MRRVRKTHNRDIPLNYEALISQWETLKKHGRVGRGKEMCKRRRKANRRKKKNEGRLLISV